MNLEITGKFLNLLPVETGQGKNGQWTKQPFILETEEQYPKKICISAWGDNAGKIQAIKPFSTVKVAISLESREWNGRWYTDVRAWKVDAVAASPGTQTDTPAGSYAINPAAASDPLQAEMQADDDLPF